MSSLERLFGPEAPGDFCRQRGEGLATFLTMSYILFVNPQILSVAGLPESDVAVVTGLATLVVGLFANYPFASPGRWLQRCLR